MRYIIKSISLGLILIVASCGYAICKDSKSLFQEANTHYSQQEYATAIKLWEDIITNGDQTSEVYYNLGNAYYKIGEIGKAVVNYERAKKLDPEDEDIDYNLKLAYKETIDKIEPLPKVFYKEWWESMVVSTSIDHRAILFVTLLWVTLVIFIVYKFTAVVIVKKALFFVLIISLLTSITLGYLTYVQNLHLSQHREAIIINTSVYVKGSPDEDAQNVFMLHEGTKVEVLDAISDWRKIKIANGNVGWTMNSELEII